MLLALMLALLPAVSAHGVNIWGPWVIDRQPTCTQPGQRHHSYTSGGQTSREYEDIPALGHDYQLTSETTPTCTAPGRRTYRCSRCGTVTTKAYGAPLGHTYKAVVMVQPTVEREGLMTYTCTRCGASYTEPIPKLIENWVIKSKVEPTSAKCGAILYEDTISGRTKTQILPALGYDWGPWTTDREATLFAPGRQYSVNRNYPQELRYRATPQLVNLRTNTVDAVMAPTNFILLGAFSALLLSDLSVIFWDLRKRHKTSRVRRTKIYYALLAAGLVVVITCVPIFLRLYIPHISYLNLLEYTALASVVPLGIVLQIKLHRRLLELNGSRGIFVPDPHKPNIISGNK